MPTPAEQYAADRITIKNAVIALVQSLNTKALVLPRFVFDERDDGWPALLRSPEDNNEIHCIQIFFAGTKQEPRATTAPGTFNPILPMGFGFFRQYQIGTDASNSEARLDAEVALVQFAIAQNLHFGQRALVHGHEGLEIAPYRLTPPLGQAGQIQYGLGRIDIEMQPRQFS